VEGSSFEPVAAIDCGTNSTRLLVVDGAGRVLAREMRITRLGEGVDATRKLAPEAMDRTLGVLAEYRRTMERLGVARARLVATSAVRDALNGAELLRAATEVTGVTAELLAGEEEGRLSHAGAVAGLPSAEGEDVVVDIGGGSTELVTYRRGAVAAVSLDIGCVRLSERYFAHDPPTEAEVAAAEAAIGSALDHAVEAISDLASLPPGSRLLGLAGTVSTLAMLDQGLATYDRSRVHHARLTRAAVERWCGILAAEPAAARARRPGMVEGREDVIVGGALVLRAVMRRLGFDECLVSESDILDGLVASLR